MENLRPVRVGWQEGRSAINVNRMQDSETEALADLPLALWILFPRSITPQPAFLFATNTVFLSK